MQELPKTLFEAGDADEGFAVAVLGGALVVQVVLPEPALRACSATRPPTVSAPAGAAVELARALLAEFAPALLAHERRRALRLMNEGDEPGADAA